MLKNTIKTLALIIMIGGCIFGAKTYFDCAMAHKPSYLNPTREKIDSIYSKTVYYAIDGVVVDSIVDASSVTDTVEVNR